MRKSLGIATPCEKGEFLTTFSTIIYHDSCVVFSCFVMYNAHICLMPQLLKYRSKAGLLISGCPPPLCQQRHQVSLLLPRWSDKIKARRPESPGWLSICTELVVALHCLDRTQVRQTFSSITRTEKQTIRKLNPEEEKTPQRKTAQMRVLFLCTGNSCR